MPRFFLFLFLIATSLVLNAQDIGFYAGGNYAFNTSHEYSRQFNSLFVTPLTDTTALRQRSLMTRTDKSSLKMLPGISLGVTGTWPIGRNLGFSSGIGLSTMAFELTREFITSTSEPVGDPEVIQIGTPGVIFGNNCTVITTEFDNNDLNRDPDYLVAYLELPFQLQYAFSRNTGVRFGGNFRTPVASSRKRDVTLIVEEENGFCSLVASEENDRSGSDLSDLTVAAGISLYHWFDDIGVAIGGEKMLSNLFVDPQHQSFTTQETVSQPFGVSLRIYFRFGRGDRSTVND